MEKRIDITYIDHTGHLVTKSYLDAEYIYLREEDKHLGDGVSFTTVKLKVYTFKHYGMNKAWHIAATRRSEAEFIFDLTLTEGIR
jgi:hypothetical protein